MLMPYEQSLALLNAQIKAYEKVEKVAITQCLDRVLAEDIYAKTAYPALPTASMDGFAVKCNEQKNALKILGQTKAGQMPSFALKENECVKTFTGSLMCEASDTLVPIENVEIKGDTLFIKEAVTKGFAVRKVGESYEKGELLLTKGTKLGFSEIALLAELGYFHISVFIKPVVGILSSGNELKDLGESLENPAQIRSSNHIALANLAQKFGAKPIIFPLIKDEEQEVSNALEQALKSCDILITTGGVSMGDFDFLKKAVQRYEVIIDKVHIKPGRHIKVAKFEDKFIFALPGFSYSSIVTFRLFVVHLLNHWLLQKEEIFEAFFKGDYEKKSPYLEFIACNLSFEKGKIYANLEGKKQGSSAITRNLNRNSALLIAEQNLKENDLVKVLLMP